MSAKLAIELVLRDASGAAVVAQLPTSLDEGGRAANVLINLLAAAAGGRDRARLVVRVDDVVTTQAARTLTINGAAVIAGEWIDFVTPGGRFRITGVASGAVDGDGTFNVSGTSNTAATNIRAAINSHPGLKSFVVASGATNAVIVTANINGAPGSIGNTIEIIDGTGGGVGTVGLLTGGRGVGARATASILITHANVTAADTVTIGGIVFTAVASGATGNQFNIGADATADAVNLAAAINANAVLAGRIVAASQGAGVLLLTFAGIDPATAPLILLATSDATAFTLTQAAVPTPTANVMAARSYNLGIGST
jgi:hypothetical protein